MLDDKCCIIPTSDLICWNCIAIIIYNKRDVKYFIGVLHAKIIWRIVVKLHLRGK